MRMRFLPRRRAISDVTLFGDTTASLSFWVKLDSTAFGGDSSAVLFSAMINGSGLSSVRTPIINTRPSERNFTCPRFGNNT